MSDDALAGQAAAPDTDDHAADPVVVERPGKVYGPLSIAALVVIIVDQVTKLWADDLQECSTLGLPRPRFAFCLAYNEGMAFSVGWGRGPLIALIALVIVAVMVFSVRKVPPGARWLMGAVAGGALGNVIDRAFRDPAPIAQGVPGSPGFMRGAVIDFFYSNFWATFNVADAAIVVGGILLSISLWRMPDPEREAELRSGADIEPRT